MRNNRVALAALIMAAAATTTVQARETATAIFAGGCFWSVESDFDHAPGVISTISGYIGGHVPNPSYDQVTSETTGHREAVKVVFDPSVTSYAKLLDTYWHLTDPTQANGQFCDHGDSYRPGLFPLDASQFETATASRADIGKVLGKRIATSIRLASTFYPAEAYHQNFWRSQDAFVGDYTRAEWYKRYRAGCRKNAQVRALWGKAAFKGLNGHE